MASVLQRLKERKLVQWALAYLAGGWVLVDSTSLVVAQFHLPEAIGQGVTVVAFFGFFVTLVLAWYHGEKGRQRVSGPELLMVAALFVVAGVALSLLHGPEEAVRPSAEVAAPAATEDDRPSIAVLPFDNFSTDSTYAFFADGMQDQILSTLGDISALRVLSRSSVMQYAENRPSSRQIAEHLAVSYLVEGSAQVSGGTVRITVQLIDALRDEHLWAENYDRELTAQNLLQVRGEVAQRIAFSVGAELTPDERDQVVRVLTENTEAYLLFLEGKEWYLRERAAGTLRPNQTSRQLFDQALVLDPNFAPAHAFVALSLVSTTPDSGRYQRARDEAQLALSILPSLGEARVALGLYLVWAGQARDAMRQFQSAEEENRNLAMAIQQLGQLQLRLGDFDQGLRSLERARSIDPFDPSILRDLTRSYIFAHRYDDASRVLDTREAMGALGSTSYDRIWLHLLRGEADKARLAVRHLLARGEGAGFYEMAPTLSPAVVGRSLTMEDRPAAFAIYEDFMERQQGGEDACLNNSLLCKSKAIHEDAMGLGEQARAHWDSLRIDVEEHPPEDWIGRSNAVLIYLALGEKEAAMEAANALVALDGARNEGAVEDRFYWGPSARLLLARALARLGEPDRAIDLLEELLPAPSWLTVHILETDPIWGPLRDHPRIRVLLEKYADDVEH